MLRARWVGASTASAPREIEATRRMRGRNGLSRRPLGGIVADRTGHGA
jgi:hypothetical protein